ncbi:hypothetical protein [Oenococcus sicerae]|uniref:Uncharacterized protein n=1 Tax=Oenococcus sicerae TaxID=2203724 RepID=A0AAJ1RA65_9LACO|nr:hypothetical protein [Oenococcus sicerae]MDN6900586.1 hypothetical protein [Oenococcus sicerae]
MKAVYLPHGRIGSSALAIVLTLLAAYVFVRVVVAADALIASRERNRLEITSNLFEGDKQYEIHSNFYRNSNDTSLQLSLVEGPSYADLN